MHDKNEIDSISAMSKDLLGLENTNPSDTNNDKFIQRL